MTWQRGFLRDWLAFTVIWCSAVAIYGILNGAHGFLVVILAILAGVVPLAIFGAALGIWWIVGGFRPNRRRQDSSG